MKNGGYIVQLSKNEKIGISGMRIILESDLNHQTQRQYKSGYKLSEISTMLKIAEIKNIFEIKSALLAESTTTKNWKELRENLYRKGWSIKIQYKGEFKANQKNEIQDVFIKKVGRSQTGAQKEGFFFKKEEGFSLSAIDYSFNKIEKEITATAEKQISVNGFNIPGASTTDTLQEIAGEVIEDFLKPNYVSQQEDEWWRKKRKMRR